MNRPPAVVPGVKVNDITSCRKDDVQNSVILELFTINYSTFAKLQAIRATDSEIKVGDLS